MAKTLKYKHMKNIILILITLFLVSCKSEPEQKTKLAKSKIEHSEQFCYLSNIYQSDNTTYATVDFIEYQKIINLAPSIEASQVIELPNGFCYLNKKIEKNDFQFTKDAKIVMQTFSHDQEGSFNFNQAITIQELTEYFKTSEHDRLKFSPFRIVLTNKKISSLTEIYIP